MSPGQQRGRTRLRVEHDALRLREVRHRRKMLPFVRKRCSRFTAESPLVVWISATLEPRSCANKIIDSRPSTSAT